MFKKEKETKKKNVKITAKNREISKLDFSTMSKSHKNLKGLIKKVINSKGASICELLMDPDEEQIPKAINKRTPEGKSVPTKFEDMYPFLSKQELNSNSYK